MHRQNAIFRANQMQRRNGIVPGAAKAAAEAKEQQTTRRARMLEDLRSRDGLIERITLCTTCIDEECAFMKEAAISPMNAEHLKEDLHSVRQMLKEINGAFENVCASVEHNKVVDTAKYEAACKSYIAARAMAAKADHLLLMMVQAAEAKTIANTCGAVVRALELPDCTTVPWYEPAVVRWTQSVVVAKGADFPSNLLTATYVHLMGFKDAFPAKDAILSALLARADGKDVPLLAHVLRDALKVDAHALKAIRVYVAYFRAWDSAGTHGGLKTLARDGRLVRDVLKKSVELPTGYPEVAKGVLGLLACIDDRGYKSIDFLSAVLQAPAGQEMEEMVFAYVRGAVEGRREWFYLPDMTKILLDHLLSPGVEQEKVALIEVMVRYCGALGEKGSLWCNFGNEISGKFMAAMKTFGRPVGLAQVAEKIRRYDNLPDDGDYDRADAEYFDHGIRYVPPQLALSWAMVSGDSLSRKDLRTVMQRFTEQWFGDDNDTVYATKVWRTLRAQPYFWTDAAKGLVETIWFDGDALQQYMSIVMVPWVASDTRNAITVWRAAFEYEERTARRSEILFNAMRRLPGGDEDGIIYDAINGESLSIDVESLKEFYANVLSGRPSVPHDLQEAFAAQTVAIDIGPLLTEIKDSTEAARAVYLYVSAGHPLPDGLPDGPQDWLSQLYKMQGKEANDDLEGPGRRGALRFLTAVATADASRRMGIAEKTLPGFGELPMRPPEEELVRAVFGTPAVVTKFWTVVAGMQGVTDEIWCVIKENVRASFAAGSAGSAGSAGRKRDICGNGEEDPGPVKCMVGGSDCCEEGVAVNWTACQTCGHCMCQKCSAEMEGKVCPSCRGDDGKRIKLR